MSPKNVLVLGAGLVSRPLIAYLAQRPDLRLLVAALEIERAEELVSAQPTARSMRLDVSDERELDRRIAEADAVVSLLPYPLHATVARHAIHHRVPMVTTSYTSPEMAALHESAVEVGVPLVNEAGLDPGLDHMSCMRVIDEVRVRGGRVESCSSSCGGLPAPQALDNPWGYKFSWSPRAAVGAAIRPARYLEGGRTIDVPGHDLVSHVQPRTIDGVGDLEIFPNGDALTYVEPYGVAGTEGMFRGSIRHAGWCETFEALYRLGLLDGDRPIDPGWRTYADMLAACAPDGDSPLPRRVADAFRLEHSGEILARLKWAGLLSDTPLPQGTTSRLDALVAALEEKLPYRDGEQDMILMLNELQIRYPGGAERRVMVLDDRGTPGGDSAMARTVSLPAAIIACELAAGRIDAGGVLIPVLPELYRPVLEELERLELVFDERVEPTAVDPD